MDNIVLITSFMTSHTYVFETMGTDTSQLRELSSSIICTYIFTEKFFLLTVTDLNCYFIIG